MTYLFNELKHYATNLDESDTGDEPKVIEWEFFDNKEELSCSCGSCSPIFSVTNAYDDFEWLSWMQPQFMTKLIELRVMFGSPLNLTSAYRCRSHTKEAKKEAAGPHCFGRAVDIHIMGADAFRLIKVVHASFSGIGISQKGEVSGRFIHLDNLDGSPGRPRPWIWSY